MSFAPVFNITDKEFMTCIPRTHFLVLHLVQNHQLARPMWAIFSNIADIDPWGLWSSVPAKINFRLKYDSVLLVWIASCNLFFSPCKHAGHAFLLCTERMSFSTKDKFRFIGPNTCPHLPLPVTHQHIHVAFKTHVKGGLMAAVYPDK